MSPAEWVIHVFGGLRKTARALNMTPGALCKWKARGGHLSSSAQRKALAAAKERGLDITPADLILGREICG